MGPDAAKPDAGAEAPKADTATTTPDAGTVQFTIWIAGDSTVATHNAASGTSVESWGWGGQFDSLFNANVTVSNNAVAGRSVRTWLYDVSSTDASIGEVDKERCGTYRDESQLIWPWSCSWLPVCSGGSDETSTRTRGAACASCLCGCSSRRNT